MCTAEILCGEQYVYCNSTLSKPIRIGLHINYIKYDALENEDKTYLNYTRLSIKFLAKVMIECTETIKDTNKTPQGLSFWTGTKLT